MSKDKELAIEVKNLSKHFRLPTEKSSSIKQTFINWTKGVKGYREQKVLDDISFNIKKGDFFGIVGRNGSGKSTLLKLISGIYQPDGGSIKVNGSLVSFIELGVGFNPELTGYDNVYLNGALLGFSTKEIDAMYDEIVEFAELGEFMDQKLKNYSSGMQVRLAFSCAIRASSDILVLDEVLAVGDEAFQRKCNDYFDKIRKEAGKTVILVTHSMEAVRKYCNRALMIRDGKIVVSGSPEDVANEYSLENLDTSKISSTTEKKKPIIKELKAELLSPKQINQKEKVKIKYTVVAEEDIEANIVMDLYNLDENYYLYCFGSPRKKLKADSPTTFEPEFDISFLNNMNVVVHTSVRDKNGKLLSFIPDKESPSFIIRRNDYQNNKRPQAGAVFKDGKNARWL